MTTRPKALAAAERYSFPHCQYALNDSRPWLFCQAACCGTGEPYCAKHRKLCWVSPPRGKSIPTLPESSN